MPVYRIDLVLTDLAVYRASTTVEASTRKEVEDAIEENDDNMELLVDSVKWNDGSISVDEELETIEECDEKPEFRLDADSVLVKVEKEEQ